MRLVVDTNVVISGILVRGTTRSLLLDTQMELYGPEKMLEEVEKYRDLYREKAGYTEAEVDALLTVIGGEIHTVPRGLFSDDVRRAEDLIGEKDPDDVPFLALAIHLNVPVWTDDTDFQHQEEVEILTTPELAERFG